MAGKKLLVIGKVWPEPSSSAAGTRILQIIELFKEEDYRVIFASAAGESEFSADLEAIDITRQAIRLNHPDFDTFIAQLKPDIVLFDRFMTEEQFGWRVAEFCPDALRILDTEDLHFLREARKLALKHNEQYDTHLVNEITVRELASIYRCDLSLVISEFEVELLRERLGVPNSLLHYMPFLVDWSQLNPVNENPGFGQRNHFVTIGNFLHPPNLDSIRFLKYEIWPHIRKELPGTELHVYGAYPSKEVLDMHKPENGFIVKGRAEDAMEVIRNGRVLLAPLRFGAGLKGKLLDAMLTATPSVTTPIGAEGMRYGGDWPGVVSENVADIVHQAIQLYTQEKTWMKAQSHIIPTLEAKFLTENHAQPFLDKIHVLAGSIHSHRSENIFGQILQHQSNAASRYMGKWIQEKNSKN
ncbi:MAG: glycosyltransferase family 4 protein [Balneolales bacterium]|nr:glycosyltransferase family 4 protein [Balneolales bacterium]